MKQQIVNLRALFLLLVFLGIFQDAVIGQRWKLRRYEVGLGVGDIQIFGDIGGTADINNWLGLKDIKLNETGLAFTTFARYKIQPHYSVKATIDLGFGRGTDEGSHNNRGRSYKSIVSEFTGQFEYYLITEEKGYRSSGMYNRRGMLNNYNHYSLYGFVGVGVAYAISKHQYTISYPQDDYKPGGNISAVFPVGLGVKLIIDSRLSLNGELGYRWPLSDYIEGYNNTYFSKHRDLYYFMTIGLTYRLKTTPRNIPAFLDRKYKRYGY